MFTEGTHRNNGPMLSVWVGYYTHCEVSSRTTRSSAEVLQLLTCLEEDNNTVVETLAIKELLLNFGLELKKFHVEFY